MKYSKWKGATTPSKIVRSNHANIHMVIGSMHSFGEFKVLNLWIVIVFNLNIHCTPHGTLFEQISNGQSSHVKGSWIVVLNIFGLHQLLHQEYGQVLVVNILVLFIILIKQFGQSSTAQHPTITFILPPWPFKKNLLLLKCSNFWRSKIISYPHTLCSRLWRWYWRCCHGIIQIWRIFKV